MAYLNKDQYDRRRENTARRMIENSTIETLTPEQHEVLSKICAARHDMHSTPVDRLLNSECSDHIKLEYFSMWGRDVENQVNIDLKRCGLPTMDIVLDYDLYFTDDYYDCDDVDQEYWESYADDNGYDSGYHAWIECSDDYKSSIDDIHNQNRIIENYLRNIDLKYGTNYCPTGSQRIY